MNYKPEGWVIVRVLGDDPHYRVFGSWSAGYLTGDSWRMNSGISRTEREGDTYLFHGESGSVYECPVNCYGIVGSYAAGILAQYVSAGVLEEVEDYESCI